MSRNRPLPAADRTTTRRPGNTPLLLAALILFGTILLSYTAWDAARKAARSELEGNFSYQARKTASSLASRLGVYEQVLRGAQGFMRGSVEISRKEFADYFALLKLDQHFPGIEALGVSRIVPAGQLAAFTASVRREGFPRYAVYPAGERAITTAITLIEPFSGRNLRAFGFDMFSAPARREAMERARDTGMAAASGKVTLVQEGGENVQSGFLMYLPVYRAGLPLATVDQRRAAIAGWVFSPFRMNDLIRGIGGEHEGDLDISVYDGTQVSDSALLYRSSSSAAPGRVPLLTRSTVINNAGRPWTLVLRSTPSLEASVDTARPRAMGLTGLGLGFLLSLVVWLLASERRRALQLAEAMTHELRQSHDHLAAEQRRMQVILQNAYDAFIAADPDGRITDWNMQAEATFGWTREEALGKDIGALIVPPELRERHYAGFRQFSGSGAGALVHTPTELVALHKNGARIPVELAIAPLPVGTRFGATAFVRDIAPRKEAEARERQRQQRLDEARAALHRAQKLEAVGKLTGGVAHDFNNILHIISANVQLMLKSDEPSRKRLHGILDAVDRGAKLSAQLLAFARRQPLHPSTVNVAHLLERMDSLLNRAAGDRIHLLTHSAPGLWDALVDPNQLENVILNLVINARDAMEGGGTVTIDMANITVEPRAVPDPDIAPGQYVRIAVSDTGSGMPPEVMEHAFEPFFTTKPEGKGTGLGLAMAHGFVKQSGGHIRLTSTEGKGTTVTICLPRSVSDVTSPAVPADMAG